ASPDSHIWNTPADKYAGGGLAIEWIEVEGPLVESWPPASVRRLLGDVQIEPLERERWIDGKPVAYQIVVDDPHSAASEAIHEFAARAFRRPVDAAESERFVSLAHQAIDS